MLKPETGYRSLSSACVVSRWATGEGLHGGDVRKLPDGFYLHVLHLGNKERHQSQRTSLSQAEMLLLSSRLYIVHYFLHGCQSNEMEKIWGKYSWEMKARYFYKTYEWLNVLWYSVLNWEKSVCFCSVEHLYSLFYFTLRFLQILQTNSASLCRHINGKLHKNKE